MHNLVGDLRNVVKFLVLGMLGKSLRRDCQMAGKVSQIARREDLDWVCIGICRRDLKLLKDRCIILPVTQEDVVKHCCQLVDLTWNRHVACLGRDRCNIFHVRFWLFLMGSSCVVSIVR